MTSVGIASVSMNREENLIQCLPSWLETGAECIHILDWNSNKNLENLIRNKFGKLDNVKFFRIDNKKPWILTHTLKLPLQNQDTQLLSDEIA